MDGQQSTDNSALFKIDVKRTNDTSLPYKVVLL